MVHRQELLQHGQQHRQQLADLVWLSLLSQSRTSSIKTDVLHMAPPKTSCQAHDVNKS